jgi:hypothetical protein
MSTSAQFAANRTNAQLSTGPRTPEGKARCAHNALKHGLSSQQLIVSPADQDEFDQIKANLLDSLAPANPVEFLAFNNVLRACWNMERCSRLMMQNEANSPEYGRLVHYYQTWERSCYRAMSELRRLQSDRALKAKRLADPAQHQIPLASGAEAILRPNQRRSWSEILKGLEPPTHEQLRATPMPTRAPRLHSAAAPASQIEPNSPALPALTKASAHSRP